MVFDPLIHAHDLHFKSSGLTKNIELFVIPIVGHVYIVVEAQQSLSLIAHSWPVWWQITCPILIQFAENLESHIC